MCISVYMTPKNKKITFALTPELEEAIEKQIESGRFETKGHVVRSALKSAYLTDKIKEVQKC